MVKEALPILDHGHHFLLVNLALLLKGTQVATVNMTKEKKRFVANFANCFLLFFFFSFFKIIYASKLLPQTPVDFNES